MLNITLGLTEFTPFVSLSYFLFHEVIMDIRVVRIELLEQHAILEAFMVGFSLEIDGIFLTAVTRQ